MDFLNKVKFSFRPIHTEIVNLNENEWINFIKNNIIKINSKPIGNLLIKKLYNFLINHKSITFLNFDKDSIIVYPKIKFIDDNNIFIIIPNTPYFQEIETIDYRLCEDVDDVFFNNLLNVTRHSPSEFRLNLFDYKFLIENTNCNSFITLAHELIHCLRFFENIFLNNTLEEDNTIYGIYGNVLYYNSNNKNIYITENSIRNEWGLLPRVSHNSKDIFCYQNYSTYSKKDLYTKQDFYT
jgi:hypothetical protein